MKDWLPIIALLAVIVVTLAWVVAFLAAPCDWIDWLPVKDVPTRCLSVDVR